MGKTKLIRCKTPHDVLVVRNRKDLDAVVSGLVNDSLSENDASTCGHNHLIVCGDLYFSTPKEKKT